MKFRKSLIAFFVLCLMLFCFSSCFIDKENKTNTYEIIQDEYLRIDFLNALSEMQADESKVSDFEKIDDWAGGMRYQFRYAKRITLTVYCNMGSTVDSINYNDTKIYHRGYEPYNVNNYIFNESYRLALQMESEDIVSLCLNYPTTAKFSSSYWATARYDNIYYLASSVEAANAFGVYSTYNFKIAYHVIEEGDSWKYKAVYLALGGKVQFNYLDNYTTKEERKTVEPKYPLKNTPTISGINLQDGVLGEYGKEEIIDGETYILYYVPYGKYLVTNCGNMGTIFVASDEMKKNSSGYLESVDIRVYTFKNGSNGTTMKINVPEKYHIELSMHTNINLQIITEN